jgi:tRNA/rRNA methyltransferase
VAGTDTAHSALEAGPAIILVAPQLGENIGAAARAMLNCGLSDLRLVRPREGWPSPRAYAMASGADVVLDSVRIFDTTEEALADITTVFASTARLRDMIKETVTPSEAAIEMVQGEANGEKSGLLFGPERTGLSNDDVVLARKVIHVPLNPGFSSLNLAQAVLLIAHAWYIEAHATAPPRLPAATPRPATVADLVNFFEHFEEALDEGGFLHPPEKRPTMVRNLRNIFQRAALTEQEVRTLHGVVSDLSGHRKRSRKPRS